MALDKNLLEKFCVVTSKAAVACYPFIGKKNKILADKAATDSMRNEINKLNIDGEVVIGEGEMDEAPMLYIGEKLGLGLGEEIDIAVDPLEGTNFAANNLPGALSVIVASPCTAPFMGAALGAALIQPDIYSYLIFFFLALGFALPYFLIALFPSLVNLLPKPGKWMESLKQLFGFMMFGAAIWLLWVLANQVDANSILFVLIGWLLLAFTAWLFIIKIKHAILIGVLIGCAYGYQLFNWDFKQQTITQSNDSISWSVDLEKELKTNGDAYFINYTAAWCITCKVNEGIAFTDEIFDLFEEKNITYLKADWTNRDPEIAQQIEKYNRSGIPLYIYWSKKLDEPMVLNEILTESYLREVINEN